MTPNPSSIMPEPGLNDAIASPASAGIANPSAEEGKAPDVVIELLSESTAEVYKTLKKQIYQDRMRVSEYFWYDPFELEDWAGFRLQGGQYRAIAPNPRGNLQCQAMDLLLVRWPGIYKGIEATWLRWADSAGALLPTNEERAAEAQQQVEATQQQLDQEHQRSEALAAKLRELGIDPSEM